MYRIAQLEGLNDPRAAEAENVLVENFRHEYITGVLTGGRSEWVKPLFRACFRAGLVGGNFYVALTDEDEVIGTALWYPPGHDFLADEKQQQEGATEFLDAIAEGDPSLYEWWMKTYCPLNAEMSNKYLGKDFKINNWNLYSLSVMEKHRRKGVARTLVKVGEDRAHAQGISTCFEAETDTNMHIYNRLGYTTVGHDLIPGPPNMEGFNYHCMVKYFDGEGIKTKQ